MKNRYFFVMLKILISAIFQRRITVKKLWNAALGWGSHILRLSKSSKYPMGINIEFWNECNANCTFCRTLDGVIFDHNPEGDGNPIDKGKMPIEIYKDIIDEVKDHLLIAVLYVNGEPLMYKDIFNAIRYSSNYGVATLISSNGMLLNDSNSRKLLDAGITFIKVQFSGMTQEIHERQSRKTDIVVIKENLRNLARLVREKKSRSVVMLDYIDYDYNRHELAEARAFAKELGFMFNRRPGSFDNFDGEITSDEQEKRARSVKSGFTLEESRRQGTEKLCPWPWKMMAMNWDNSIYPCCDYMSWSNQEKIGVYDSQQVSIATIWNGPTMREYRKIHARQGRKAILICSHCERDTIAFKE